MRLKCNRCGKEVSTHVPENTVILAWVECLECLSQDHRLTLSKFLKVDIPDNTTLTSTDVISPAE
jgi:hypothetical protein